MNLCYVSSDVHNVPIICIKDIGLQNAYFFFQFFSAFDPIAFTEIKYCKAPNVFETH